MRLNKMNSMDVSHPALHADLSPTESEIVRRAYDFTEDFFQNPKFDASHDFNHVKRVVHNATVILKEEIGSRHALDTLLVLLGALLHDVEDKKYAPSTTSSPMVDFLHSLSLGSRIDPELVKKLVDGVSYSSEINDPEGVQKMIVEIPELAIVQDADRLDAIGAIGIGRCFTFGGAKAVRSLDDSIQHFDDKLLKLESMMKTRTGRRMAAERSRRIREFVEWWKDEQP